MNAEEILASLKEIFANVKPKQDLSGITPQTRLLEDLAMDSLTMLLLSLSIETTFGIRIETGARFDTVGDVIEYIQKCKA